MRKIICFLFIFYCITGRLIYTAEEEERDVFPFLDELYVINTDTPACLGKGSLIHLDITHFYPVVLHNFGFTGKHPGLIVEIEPKRLPALKISENVEFTVKITPLPNADLKGGRITIPLQFYADELDSKKLWSLVLPLSAAEEKKMREEEAAITGSVEVRVRWWAGFETWLYSIGSLAIIVLFLWRWRKWRHLFAKRPVITESSDKKDA
jgi:hypothetical protein